MAENQTIPMHGKGQAFGGKTKYLNTFCHLCPKRQHLIQIYKKSLYSKMQFAIMRSELENSVGKTILKDTPVLIVSKPVVSNTLEGFPSGQREQTVNLPAPPSMVRIRPPPPFLLDCLRWENGS